MESYNKHNMYLRIIKIIISNAPKGNGIGAKGS